MTTAAAIAAARMHAQQIASQRFRTPAELVTWMGAVQAQDYLGALWAIGLRLPGATAATVEAAIADGSIVRIHALRGTWQLIARDDVRWMLALVAARITAASASRHRQLRLSPATLARSRTVLAQAAAGGHWTRAELGAALARARIAPTGQRLLHLLGDAELHGVLCSGARRGKQVTFAALAERVPAAALPARPAAIAELARRYVASRAPATLADFTWWTGLPAGETRAAFTAALAAAPAPAAASVRGAYLIPAFDELLVGYTDRSAVLDPAQSIRINAGGGMLNPAIVVDGRVIGTWKRTLERAAVVVALEPFATLTGGERAAIDDAAARYGAFLGVPARTVVSARWRPRRRRR